MTLDVLYKIPDGTIDLALIQNTLRNDSPTYPCTYLLCLIPIDVNVYYCLTVPFLAKILIGIFSIHVQLICRCMLITNNYTSKLKVIALMCDHSVHE